MKFSNKQKLGVVSSVFCLLSLAIIGGSLYEAVVSENWRTWFVFAIFGVGSLIPSLMKLLDALGILDRIIY